MNGKSSITPQPDMARALLDALAEHDVHILAFDHQADSRWIRYFQQQPGWAVDFEDHEAVLFVRTPPEAPTMGGF